MKNLVKERFCARKLGFRSVVLNLLLLLVCGCGFPAPQQVTSRLQNLTSHTERSIPERKYQITLRGLENFISVRSRNSQANLSDLRADMDRMIHLLDSLAVNDNVGFGGEILQTLSVAHLDSLNVARRQSDEMSKGLWLEWSERLLLTRSGLRHYFSEIQLNFFENRLDNLMFSSALELIPALRAVFHPTHESRLISIFRAHAAQSNVSGAILNLLADSGGPLARLYIYQRFKAKPTLLFAEAMAKAGLPRTSDLIPNNSFLNNGPFYRSNQTESTAFGNVLDSVRDFPERWKDMKAYLETLKDLPERLMKSRRFWVDMHSGIETKLNQLEIPSDKKAQLKKAILQNFRSGIAPEKLTYRRDGLEFREGDIILVQAGETGGLWETFTHSGSLLSHLMMVTFDDLGLPYTIEINFGQVLLAPLDLRAERYVVLRAAHNTEALRKRIHSTFRNLLSHDITYDFQFNSNEHEKLYCSEFAAAVLDKSEAGFMPFAFSPASPRAAELLRKSGIPSVSFYGQGSYLGSEHFEFIGERIFADPQELIRGQMILSEFRKYLSSAYAVRMWHHPDAPTILGLSSMAQTLHPNLKRGLGPQPFLFTVMILDRLTHAISDDVRNSSLTFRPAGSRGISRLVTLKQTISTALETSVPSRLSSVFPNSKP